MERGKRPLLGESGSDLLLSFTSSYFPISYQAGRL
jgi:hypothetical protein